MLQVQIKRQLSAAVFKINKMFFYNCQKSTMSFDKQKQVFSVYKIT